ncbi:carbonic anhydrase [Halogeometricum borinquense]|uniref:carbonic anhydrase n=1 Tax=Halogeometricum borinquense TaxID=60847 RepID=A0A6C0UE48_9EURY|nr:carbonic anhydrase [Halogeometricum borinquense]QIB73674.1 carbonic anhydrase [Halogeometricum borinquense]QIQ76970.1 carbonic anhydrase [Halogeometricum borinquense]
MEVLERLLDGNDEHVAQVDDDHFEGVRDGQDPPVVSVSCSDSRVPAEGVWDANADGDLFTSVNVGNQAWTDVDGELVVNDAVGYAVSALDVELIAVLGHTGCGAITAAYESVTGESETSLPPAVEAAVARLTPIVESAREDGVFDDDTPRGEAVNKLVERAVQEQVDFLVKTDAVPDDVAVAGLVYDFQHAYGNDDGAAYLVSLDGETEDETLRERVSPSYHEHVASLR